MADRRFFMLQVITEGEVSSNCTLAELACRVGLHPELIERFLRLGLIEYSDLAENGDPLFDSGVVPIIRRILRLHDELGINYVGIGVVLELMSRLETLEARIRELESAVQ